ncbi:uncharacterized protein B0J16DRAFT_93005 [Fusarium flagelliforme]|uniref:uncharacterized protein n=1 Tax=Fusarium flagelliforme TaxID=2675880 RepID=UPI001E8E4D4D|nr:uncharacterized protein B0J16DRAFT_93005 [Fusarium flagelliforme]KAH7188379.1 hypothetical protein B0J16DRAFT_93005 [Fusarium flagelliforme]
MRIAKCSVLLWPMLPINCQSDPRPLLEVHCHPSPTLSNNSLNPSQDLGPWQCCRDWTSRLKGNRDMQKYMGEGWPLIGSNANIRPQRKRVYSNGS